MCAHDKCLKESKEELVKPDYAISSQLHKKKTEQEKENKEWFDNLKIFSIYSTPHLMYAH